jgi:hypothetical protein
LNWLKTVTLYGVFITIRQPSAEYCDPVLMSSGQTPLYVIVSGENVRTVVSTAV